MNYLHQKVLFEYLAKCNDHNSENFLFANHILVKLDRNEKLTKKEENFLNNLIV